MDLVKLSPTHSYSKGSLGQEDLSLLHRPPAGEPCLSSLLHVFYLKPFHSLSSLRTYNLPVYLAVHTNQQDKGDHSVDDEVEVDEVDLDVERVGPELGGVEVAGVTGGVAGHHHHLQLEEPGEVVNKREYCDRENIEERGPGSGELKHDKL